VRWPSLRFWLVFLFVQAVGFGCVLFAWTNPALSLVVMVLLMPGWLLAFADVLPHVPTAAVAMTAVCNLVVWYVVWCAALHARR
jgi:hypothetical protein